jgi:uncharacterized protein
VTERRFSRRNLLAATLVASAPVTSSRSGERVPRKYRYIDIHTHVGRYYWGKDLTLPGLLKLMDRHDIERACVLPLVSPESTVFPQTSDDALAAFHAHPDRIIPFCCIDPRTNSGNLQRAGRLDLKSMTEVLTRFRDLGAKGFGEHQVGLPFDHPLMMTVYEACARVGLPILFHLDDIRGSDTPGLPRLERVLKSFPDLPMIGHAAGFWASISGDAGPEDFRRYLSALKPVAPGGALDRLLGTYPNLYGDLSEPGGYWAIHRDEAFGRAFLIRWADRLLFGTDFLQADQEVPQFDLLDSLNLPDAVQAKIYRGNAIRLLKPEGLK